MNATATRVLFSILLTSTSGCTSGNLYPDRHFSPPDVLFVSGVKARGMVTQDVSRHLREMLVRDLNDRSEFRVIEVVDEGVRTVGLMLETDLLKLNVGSRKNKARLAGAILLMVTVVGIYPSKYINTDEIYCELKCLIEVDDLRKGGVPVFRSEYEIRETVIKNPYTDRGRIVKSTLQELSKKIVSDLLLHIEKRH